MSAEPAECKAQDEVVPLSGNPYFTIIISKSQIQQPFRLVVPKEFRELLPPSPVWLTLSCKNKTWEVRYCGDRYLKRFETGWKKFAIENNLEIGDGCVFELMDNENLNFGVRVLKGEIPSLVRNIEDGRSSDSPIMID
uniref:TF-B3 domain-containing protein n=1 Tax=Ananas comosus var. bracteatus TaxID=296719 RepID=A0A6V7QPB1_ANACO|nr:unnamed protein product [Ananas comosus var. bracteatus]